MRALLVMAALAALGLPPIAHAETGRLEAVLAAPEAKRMVVLDSRVWRCDSNLCLARSPGRSQSLSRECARVARKLGLLSAYSRNGMPLTSAQIKTCNAWRSR